GRRGGGDDEANFLCAADARRHFARALPARLRRSGRPGTARRSADEDHGLPDPPTAIARSTKREGSMKKTKLISVLTTTVTVLFGPCWSGSAQAAGPWNDNALGAIKNYDPPGQC